MIKSMTGFGRSEKTTQDYRISVEMKAVNHRYCDINMKLPKKFNAFENTLRNTMKEYASRGKIDIYISYEDYAGRATMVAYHETVAKGYMDAVNQAASGFGLERGMTAASLIRLPEVIALEEKTVDEEALFPVLDQVFREAAQRFASAREKEGGQLYLDLMDKLDGIETMVGAVEQRSPQMMAQYRQKITDKVEELLGDREVDERILATELTIYADKICVDEETVRLRSHIKNMRETLRQGENIGRKLDFIAQEMNREANTILSKANDRELSNIAIDLKTEIEKVREQIQNIE